MADNVIDNLKKLYVQWSGSEVDRIEELPAHGSYRKYYRLYSGVQSVIAAHNEDKAENIAFLKFSRQFRKAGMPVPEIFAADEKHDIYLEEDLGVSVIVENKPGGAGIVGSTEFLTKDASGYQLICLNDGALILAGIMSNASFLPKDFAL